MSINSAFHIVKLYVLTGKPSKLYDRTNIDWAPTQKMGHSFLKSSSEVSAAIARSGRAAERERKRKLSEDVRCTVKKAKSTAFIAVGTQIVRMIPWQTSFKFLVFLNALN